jgi:NhaP-type Na+/H+ and K+/H+ antiporter
MALADFIAARTVRMPRAGDVVPIGTIALVVHRVTKGRVASIGLRLAEELEPEDQPATLFGRLKRTLRRLWARLS